MDLSALLLGAVLALLLLTGAGLLAAMIFLERPLSTATAEAERVPPARRPGRRARRK